MTKEMREMTGATQKKTLRQRLCVAADGWPTAQRQAGNVSTARRGCGESAGAADDHAAKEYGAT